MRCINELIMKIGSNLPTKVNMASSIATSPNRINLTLVAGLFLRCTNAKNWAEFAMLLVLWDEFPQRSTFTSSLTISSLNLNTRFSGWGCWFRDAKHFIPTSARILSTLSHTEQAPVSFIKRRVGVVDELQEKSKELGRICNHHDMNTCMLLRRSALHHPEQKLAPWTLRWGARLGVVDETPTLRKLKFIGRDLPCHLDMIFGDATTFATGKLHPRARSKTCRAR